MFRRFCDIISFTLVHRRDAISYARSLGVKLGSGCRILDHPRYVFGSEPYLVSLGDHVTVTSGVRFVTHDGGVWVFRAQYPDIDAFGPVRVGNNVFLGFNCLIMPSVTIGDNCVVGAGSIVTKSIASDSVVAGCPARPIRTIQEYRKKVEQKAVHIRSLRAADKRDILLRRFSTHEASSIRP
jgi:acetyltransferase-like isoleucine patch superfamily enzyme